MNGANAQQQGPPQAVPAPPDPQQAFYRSLVDRLNERRPMSSKPIPVETFKAGADFDQWVQLFVDTVVAVYSLGPNDQVRLGELCIKWLPTKLEGGATRAVFDNLTTADKANWGDLKKALSKAFRDESEEISFINNEAAWRRRPGMSLRDYRNGLVTRLDKYQPELRNVITEWERCAVRRFRAGLENPILSAHILMSCVGDKHTLESAFSVAATYENTMRTIGQSDSHKNIDPTMASMLPIPQLSSLSLEPPQFAALGSQEKNEKRFCDIETAQKKQELDMGEVKAGLGNLKEDVKAIKDEVTRPKSYQRPLYQTQFRPQYPIVRMPVQRAPARGYYPSYNRFAGSRPQVLQGLTGGPGFVTHQPTPLAQTAQPANASQARQAAQPANAGQARPSRPNQISQDPNTLGAAAPAMGAIDGGENKTETFELTFPNPNLQFGSTDTGYGWTHNDLNDASEQGYDLHPDGVYVFSDMPF